jgi:hypothetical protein
LSAYKNARSPEGSEEWNILHRRYYAEEPKKLGIDIGSR